MTVQHSHLYSITEQVHNEHKQLHLAQVARGNWVPDLSIHDHPHRGPCQPTCETLAGTDRAKALKEAERG